MSLQKRRAMKDTYERYSEIRDKKQFTDYKVCKLAGINTSTMSSWKSNRYEPKIPTMKKIAEVLDCDVSDFYMEDIRNEIKPDIPNKSIDEIRINISVVMGMVAVFEETEQRNLILDKLADIRESVGKIGKE